MPKITRTSAGRRHGGGFAGIGRASQVRRISTTVIMDGRAEDPRPRSAPARSRAGGAIAPGGRRAPRRRRGVARARAGGAPGAGRGTRLRRRVARGRRVAAGRARRRRPRAVPPPRGGSRRPAGAPRAAWSRSCGSTSSRRGSGADPRRSTARRAPRSRRRPSRASTRSMRPSRAICRISSLALVVPVAVLVARRLDRPARGRGDGAHAAARPDLHVARRPLHRAPRPRAVAAMSLLANHFLDVVRGLPTLRAFNRGQAQVERIVDGQRRVPARLDGDAPRRVSLRRGARARCDARDRARRRRRGRRPRGRQCRVRAGADGAGARARALPPASQPRGAVPRERGRSGGCVADARPRGGRAGLVRGCARRRPVRGDDRLRACLLSLSDRRP